MDLPFSIFSYQRGRYVVGRPSPNSGPGDFAHLACGSALGVIGVHAPSLYIPPNPF